MSWLRWTALTTVGYALGATVGVGLLNAFARPFGLVAGGIPFILVFGCVFGAAVAVPQVLGAPRVVAHPVPWILLSALGSAAGFALAALVGERLGDALSPTGNIIIAGGAIQGLSGATLGLAMGVAQSRAGRAPGLAGRWILATVIGTGLGYGAAAAVLELLEVEILRANLIPSFGAIVGALTGLAQAAVLAGYRRPSATSGSD